MSFQPRALLLLGGIALLSACGGGADKNDMAALDAKLTNSVSDPAIDGALNDSIVTDPDLTAQSNSDAIKPADVPPSGAVPQPIAGGPAALAEARTAQAEALRNAGGRIEKAPPAMETDTAPDRPLTLGAMAREQAANGGGAARAAKPAAQGCSRSVTYGAEWADRLPAAFAIYPRAHLVEAAGVSNGRCDITIASFTTSAPIDGVLDYYYTQARRSGYDAEHLVCEGEHRLGGTRGRDGAAYLIFARRGAGGRTEVDIVANIG